MLWDVGCVAHAWVVCTLYDVPSSPCHAWWSAGRAMEPKGSSSIMRVVMVAPTSPTSSFNGSSGNYVVADVGQDTSIGRRRGDSSENGRRGRPWVWDASQPTCTHLAQDPDPPLSLLWFSLLSDGCKSFALRACWGFVSLRTCSL
jgi:hypothetical protein